MTPRWSSLLGWGSFAFACAATTAGVLIARGSDVYRPVEVRSSTFDLFWAAAFLLLPAVGALIMSRKPGNKIGWILCGMGVAFGLGLFTGEYGKYAQVVPDSELPGRALVSWFSISFRFAFLLPMLFLFLFPDGRPASRFWGWVVKAALIVFVLGFIAEVFMPGEIEGSAGISNPTGIEALRGPLEALFVLTEGATAVLYLLAAAAPFARYRRATGDQRQQLKWVAYATLVFIGLMASTVLFDAFVPEDLPGIAAVVTFLAFASLAGAVGVSILKHRLYDIDLVINRTLVYATLTALLAGTYLVLILVAQLLARPLSNDSDIAVAASTLAVAALFRPLRSRVQGFIDKRFYRRRYDATLMLSAFSTHLRDEVSLDAIRDGVLGVVQNTVQPSSLSLTLMQETRT
ncbi:MAG: hypothetical protein ACR2KQ_02935 [Actinomycetota bacterium]